MHSEVATAIVPPGWIATPTSGGPLMMRRAPEGVNRKIPASPTRPSATKQRSWASKAIPWGLPNPEWTRQGAPSGRNSTIWSREERVGPETKSDPKELNAKWYAEIEGRSRENTLTSPSSPSTR